MVVDCDTDTRGLLLERHVVIMSSQQSHPRGIPSVHLSKSKNNPQARHEPGARKSKINKMIRNGACYVANLRCQPPEGIETGGSSNSCPGQLLNGPPNGRRVTIRQASALVRMDNVSI